MTDQRLQILPSGTYSATLQSIGRRFNLLERIGNYSAISKNMNLAHWLLMGGLLHLVQRGSDWAGPQPIPSPLLTVPYVTAHAPINGQCTNHRIAV